MSPDSLAPAAQTRTPGEFHSPSVHPAILRVESNGNAVQKIGAIKITPQARRYALWELARRAGVPRDMFRAWTIHHEPGGTLLETSTGKQIFFPTLSDDALARIASNQSRTVKRCWMYSPREELKSVVPDFVVPFVGDSPLEAPLFTAVSHERIECAVDLLLAVLLTLSRWEESVATDRDCHGRFQSKQSVALKDGFLERPIVDEYGLAFEQVLTFLQPTWRPATRKLRAKISHDADHVGIPFRGRNILKQLAYCGPLKAWHELWAWLPECEPADLCAIREIVNVTRDHKLDSAVYWMSSAPSLQDSGYDPRHLKIQKVIGWLKAEGVECGVQPGYNTFRSPERLRREINLLREIFGDGPVGGRQHYLRWCPDTWIHWEMCGLAYDSTVAYADHIGFRAGTCIPYQPWLLSLNRAADLLEIPLLVMDRTLLYYMGLNEETSVQAVRRCVQRCRQVGGVFTMVWHNNALLEPKYRSLYTKILRELDGAESFDWKREFRPEIDGFARKRVCVTGS